MRNNKTKIINLFNFNIIKHNSNIVSNYFGVLLLLILFTFNSSILTSQNNNSRNKYYINGEVTPANMNTWMKDIDSNNGNAFGYEILRNVVTYCQRRGFYSEAYFILHNFKQSFLRDSNYFRYNLNFLEHFIASTNIDSTKIEYLEKFIQINQNKEIGLLALKRRIGFEANSRNWDNALKLIKKFQPIYPIYKDYFDELVKIYKEPSKNISINSIGKNINTSFDEWDPNPTPDRQYLYFSASHKPGGYGNTDIWVSELKDNKWQKPENLGQKINNKYNETIDNVSTDGNTILLSGNFANTFGEFDIYIVERENGQWETTRHLPMPINSVYTDEGACISSDGQVLIFTSDRPGGVGEFIKLGTRKNGSEMGNLDLYICFKTPTGWTNPINMGTTINTKYAERAPFLHPDGKTLYFSSEGHPGLGSLDVFKTTRLNDTSWTEWSKPINLGKELNTISDDWGYKITVKGDSAIFSALNRTIGEGGWDIFSVSLPETVQPNKVVTIKGRVLDTKGKPLQASIKWEDLSNGKFMGELKSNAKNGNYFIALPLGKNFGYYAEKNGYYPVSQNIDLSKAKLGAEINYDIIMTSIEDIFDNGKEVVINNIFFDYNKSNLKSESFPELNRLYSFVNNLKDYKLEIVGHTDNIGGKEFNKDLSEKRAEEVAQYLIKKGINQNNINIIGSGSEKPIAPNDNEENRAKNRRVEFKILHK